MIRNGRRILVWNMEDAQNGMEDLKNGMEDRLPYLPNSELLILKLITNHTLNVMRLAVYQYAKSDRTIFANYSIWPEIIAT